MTVVPNCTSNAIECQKRAYGATLGLRCVQLMPSHSQVSATRCPLASRPPKRTTWLRMESKASDSPKRADGEEVGASLVHVMPSNAHVSPSTPPEPPFPP